MASKLSKEEAQEALNTLQQIKAQKEKELKQYTKSQTFLFDRMLAMSPGLTTIVGKPRQGKTIFCACFVKYAMEKKHYDKVWVVSPSIHTGFWTRNGIKKDSQVETLGPEAMEKLIKMQKEAKKRPSILLVLDDILASDLSSKDSHLLTKMVSIMRHLNITPVVISQTVTRIPMILRNSADFFVAYRQVGHKAMETLFENISMGEIDRKDFYTQFVEDTQDHCCIVLDNTTDDISKRYHRFKADPAFFKVKVK